MSESQTIELARDGAAQVPEACRFLGIGRTRLYDLMGDGSLKYTKIGARRVIPRVELRRYLASVLADSATR